MNAELFINVTQEEMYIALLEDKRLVELRREKRNVQFEVGDIYIGKIRKIMPGLNAAFVNIGYEKDAFLHYLDLGPQFRTLNKFLKLIVDKRSTNGLPHVRRESDLDKNGAIANILEAGQEVLVQVVKEPISTKGPRLTSEISLAGRNLVLIPFSDKVSVSKKIKSGEERNRLKQLTQKFKPKDFGVIIRTVAENKPESEIESEFNYLMKRWNDCISKVRDSRPPALALCEMERATAMLRDILSPEFNSIYVNDGDVLEEIKDYVRKIAPDRTDIVKLYNGKVPMFDNFNIEKQIKQACGKIVSFKNGAYLIIETTEALNVIDVNSGNRSRTAENQENNALEVNLAAADEIARQLRLRDMGGIVVVDFIDMQSSENRLKLYERMKAAMASDRTKHNILPLSKFGLMQITRQRVRPVMTIDTSETCPTCMGTGKIQTSVVLPDMIEAAIQKAASEQQKGKIILRCHPFVRAFLKKGFPSKFLKWKFKYGFRLKIQQSVALGLVDFKIIQDSDNIDIDETI
ncbi:MAG: Rne/Rng family ribonuclease [Bacteroidales bacterium]|nr:Rne/Rng family ribonuclease [Bacteroidales bacterium]